MEVERGIETLAEIIFATDQSDEDVAIDVFEMLGTNHAIFIGQATVEDFLQKSKARRSKQCPEKP